MNDHFLREMNLEFDKCHKYRRPGFITLSGNPGSGKTLCSQELSRELGIYLLSNDYIRSYYNCMDDLTINVEQKVSYINRKRFIKLLLNRISFVMDSNNHNIDTLNKLRKLAYLLNYEFISIRLISQNDQENIQRISKRIMDLDNKIFGVIGDNSFYSTSYTEKEYYNIVSTKPIYIPNYYFDYIIYNQSTEENFLRNIHEVIDDISSKKLVKSF